MKSLLDRVGYVTNLWTLAIGDVPLPTDNKILQWCATYSESEVEHGMMRASNKLHKGDIARSTSEVERYISGVMSNEAQKTKEKLARTLARVNGGRVAA